MTYILPQYRAHDDAQLLEIARGNPFALLITVAEGQAQVSHLPLLVDESSDRWRIVGHMARNNPHWRVLEGRESRVVFTGPNAYITPTWYQECDVPTWNYVAAHFLGRARLLEGRATTESALRKLSEAMEAPDGWKFAIPDDLAGGGVLEKAIVAFEIEVEQKLGKLKLGQNRSQEDIAGVIAGLGKREGEGSLGVRGWMERVSRKKES